MIATWMDFGSAIANHLWQSTLFAAAAALLVLLFRKNHARVRHALWFAASIKFLIPFALFIAIGTSINFSGRQSGIKAQPAITFVRNASLPFSSAKALPAIPSIPKPENSWHLQTFVFAVWLCGFLSVLTVYLSRGKCVATSVRDCEPLTQGRAVEALRRLESIDGRWGPLKLASSRSLMEPGVFGVFHPVLLLPAGITEHLRDSELEAILAHELSHVRRRDNLIAAIHMFIEALFWFHPMIWWVGAKLIQERERACDEDVLQLGKDPQAYAEGILKVCEFYLESPLACVAGVTGTDMKKRIYAIMTHHIGCKLGLAKKLLLAGAAIIAISIPLAIGLLNAPQIQAQSQNPGEKTQRNIEKPSQEPFAPPLLSPTNMPNPAVAEISSTMDAAYVPTMTFDVASVRESKADAQGGFFIGGGFSPQNSSHVRLTNNNLLNLVLWAYTVDIRQIEWTHIEFGLNTLFTVEAKSDSATDERLTKLTKEQVRLEQQHMFQVLLAERFKLKVHWEMRNGATYSLLVAKAGKLQSTGAPPGAEELKNFGDHPIPPLYQHGDSRRGFEYTAHGATTADIAQMLSMQFGSPVVDNTGLTGKYDFTLKTYLIRASDRKDDETNPWPPLETAIRDQLGLKLVSSHGQVKTLVIDHVEKPSEN